MQSSYQRTVGQKRTRPSFRRSTPVKKKKVEEPKIHAFKRTYDGGDTIVTTDGINPTLVAFNFSVNDMPGYTELTAMYDFYKITGVLLQ